MYLKSRSKEEGFSLIELVVVVSVLSVLSAITIPSFFCIQKKSKASTALAAMRQIQKECVVKEIDSGSSATFSQGNLDSYQIQSNGSNGCSGEQTSGLISAIPNDTTTFPSFILETTNNLLTYSFKGVSGVDFNACLSAICGSRIEESIDGRMLASPGIWMPDTLTKRGCSAYVLVKGSSWTEANENAQKLGGFLTTPNNADENQYLINTYTDKLSSPDPNWGNGLRAGAWIGLSSDSEGNFNWANGNDLEEGYESPYGAGQGGWNDEYHQSGQAGGFHLLMKDPSGHAERHGGLNGWWQEPVNPKEYYGLADNAYWAYNWGIAEVPTCD